MRFVRAYMQRMRMARTRVMCRSEDILASVRVKYVVRRHYWFFSIEVGSLV